MKSFFPQLVAEVSNDAKKRNEVTAPILSNDVDRLLSAFRDKTAPMVPRADILAEAHREYLKVGEVKKAQQLLDDMEAVYGVHPLSVSFERQANAYVVLKNDPYQAYRVLKSVRRVTSEGQRAYCWTIRKIFERDNAEFAWEVFDELQSKAIPSAEVANTMIMQCGKRDEVERAFLLYRRLVAMGMTTNAPCTEALIYAASKRKEYFPKAIELFRQMELLKMPVNIKVYNHLLQACSKVADLNTAMALWQSVLDSSDPTIRPTVYTCTNYLWALSAVETPSTKISKRDFVYQVSKDEIVRAAEEVIQYMKDNGIASADHTVSALLAIYSNLRLVEKAEKLFWETNRTLYSYDFMFKLYDNVQSYAGAAKIYAQMVVDQVRAPYEAWRALIRTAALCDKLDESITHLKEMRSQGYRPAISDFKTVLLRIHERERYDLEEEFKNLCINDENRSRNPFVPWLKRSEAVGDLLKRAYGKDAPETTSQLYSASKSKHRLN